MPKTYRVTPSLKTLNFAVSALVKIGTVPAYQHLLTTRGRRTGKPRTTPVSLVIDGDRRWLVAPYGGVGWVHNARAAGRVTLRRGRESKDYAIREVGPAEAAPVLERYVKMAPIVLPYFDARKDSPRAAFEAEADRHPVFELTPVT
jgi:deazaflavin-dependent oxidoreductase (nitroreductase family)